METGELERRKKKEELQGRGEYGNERGRTKGKQDTLERLLREECGSKGEEEVKCKEKGIDRLRRRNREETMDKKGHRKRMRKETGRKDGGGKTE